MSNFEAPIWEADPQFTSRQSKGYLKDSDLIETRLRRLWPDGGEESVDLVEVSVKGKVMSRWVRMGDIQDYQRLLRQK